VQWVVTDTVIITAVGLNCFNDWSSVVLLLDDPVCVSLKVQMNCMEWMVLNI
jgi:hypothetical protein